MTATRTQMISEPGICPDVPEDVYHADPCPEPSLSASVAKVLLDRSPLHAWAAHPRLNPDHQPEEAEKFDKGTAAHAYLLEGKDAFAVIDAKDWRTKAAQAERDAARAEGYTPLLKHQWAEVQAMADAANRQLDEYQDGPRPFTEGRAELTAIWRDHKAGWCRSRIDWLRDDLAYIDDYKTTAASASPHAWDRTLASMGYDVQVAMNTRGIAALTGAEPTMRYIVQENTPPYALCVISLPPEWLDLAKKKLEYAMALWSQCLKRDWWPGYPTQTCYLEPPAWEVARWESFFSAQEAQA